MTLDPTTKSGAWYLASRPHTLPAALAPVAVAAGLAIGDGAFRWGPLIATAIGALAIQVAANFTNDLSDARKGADNEDRIGPQRAVASGLLTERAMELGTWVAFAVATVAGVYLFAIAGWVIVIVGVASILATLGYVGGPKPYGYRGLGEVFVFVFFGLVATVVSRFVYDRAAPLDAWLLAIPMGFLVTAILVANNVRDIETDRSAGKRTLAVIMGRDRTRILFDVLVWGSFVLIGVFALAGWTPAWTALALVTAPLAIPLTGTIHRETSGPALIGVLKGVARLDLVFGILVAIGAAIG
ncbi:MAG: 1,4-dihydroxy-2-naphthoate polyprenyltransferase [Actinobacteria bacterium]|nr:1,4-dihydroxy-2-naphthoate polyprenyltransferase [Actinomycetota bacterium]